MRITIRKNKKVEFYSVDEVKKANQDLIETYKSGKIIETSSQKVQYSINEMNSSWTKIKNFKKL